MTKTPLQHLQSRLGYSFRDPALLSAALTHSSAAAERGKSNERLEFLGDAVLGLVICQTLFERFPEAQEGELTKIKSAVVSRRACAAVADALGLPELLVLGKGMDGGDNMPRSLAAAALEAVIAAVYLDSGLEAARTFILRHMAEEIRASADSEHRFNYKSQLQQYAQREMNQTPQYELLDEKGPDHAKCFEIAVCIGSRRFPAAWAPSKKEAEQKAALNALRAVGVLQDDAGDDADENAA